MTLLLGNHHYVDLMNKL